MKRAPRWITLFVAANFRCTIANGLPICTFCRPTKLYWKFVGDKTYPAAF